MTKVYAPNKKYNGVSAGVRFVNGEGETDDKRILAWFESKGYQVGEQEPEEDDSKEPTKTQEPKEPKEPEPKAPVKKTTPAKGK